MARIEGGCLCGSVRYSAEAEPAFIGVCHCVTPQSEIYCASAQPWVRLGGTLKRFAKAPG